MYAGEADGRWPMPKRFGSEWDPGAQGDAFRAPPCNVPNFEPTSADVLSLYGDYLADLNLWLCPSDPGVAGDAEVDFAAPASAASDFGFEGIDPCKPTADSYIYLGWMIPDNGNFLVPAGFEVNGPTIDQPSDLNPIALLQFVEAIGAWENYVNNGFQNGVGDPPGRPAYNEDLDLDGADLDGDGEDLVALRIREGVSRFQITDVNNPSVSPHAASFVPAMWDVVDTNAADFNHVPGGSNVLYMDGHVEFARYPGLFPMTRAFAVTVSAFEILSGIE
jgi:prepilin-type processing-associated H-X9-DG protein